MSDAKPFLLILLVGAIYCRYVDPLFFTVQDLHLDDVTDVTMLSDAKFLVKRATDAIMQRDTDAKENQYEFSYKTDNQEHYQKGMLVNGDLSVVGAYSVKHPDGITQTTMYVADKRGYRPLVKLRYNALLKSAVG